jgi:opacity protein-like surface antigen
LSNPSQIFNQDAQTAEADPAQQPVEMDAGQSTHPDGIHQTGGMYGEPGQGTCSACLNSPHDADMVFNCPGKCCDWSDHWYISVSGGWSHRDRVHEMDDGRTFIEFQEGFAANAALGYRFDILRLELEYSFMNQGVDRAGAGTPGGALASNAAGNVNLKALMLNAYTDFQLFDWPWLPYFGAGLGIYQSSLNGLYPTFFGNPALPANFPITAVNATSDVAMAWQFRAGLTRRIGSRTEFFTGYRYFRGDTLTFASGPFASPVAPTFQPNGATVNGIEVGLRVRF